MILDNEFTGDMRVENEIIALRNIGFEVYLLCLNHGGKKNIEDYRGAKVIRINIPIWLKKKMKGLTNTIIDLYTWYWSREIKKFVKKRKIDVIHVHDLYLVGAAINAKKKLKSDVKIVADLHENYPEALKHYKFTKTFPGKYLISIPKWEKTEIVWLNQVDYVITVIEEAVERYSKLGVPREKLTVVANYVNENEFTKYSLNDEILKKFKDRFVISYLGAFDSHRGLESLISAFKILGDKNINANLVLVGAGKNAKDLLRLAIDLGVDDKIYFEGWQRAENLPSYISISDICVIPHLKTEHTDNTIPHKLFHYMVMEKTVVASNCKPLERIINLTNCGMIYESGNANSLAEKIQNLISDPNLCISQGKNGKKAVEDEFNWNSTSKKLIDIYSQIESSISR